MNLTFSTLLDFAMTAASSYIREYDLASLVPSDYNYILTNIKDVSVLLGREAQHFMKIAFNYND